MRGKYSESIIKCLQDNISIFYCYYDKEKNISVEFNGNPDRFFCLSMNNCAKYIEKKVLPSTAKPWTRAKAFIFYKTDKYYIFYITFVYGLIGNMDTLADLAEARSHLHITTACLNEARSNLNEARADLNDARADLNDARDAIQRRDDRLEKATADLGAARNEIQRRGAAIEARDARLERARNEIQRRDAILIESNIKLLLLTGSSNFFSFTAIGMISHDISMPPIDASQLPCLAEKIHSFIESHRFEKDVFGDMNILPMQ